MAGHSHFKNIKRRKEAVDQKKAEAFSKISRIITSSVRQKGKDVQLNPSLRIAIERAKEVDMPKKNIEKAIRRGAGEGEYKYSEPFTFEAYGPNEVALIIEGFTDNSNRDLGEIKEILKRNNGKLASPGSVKWLFEKKGIIEVEKDKINEQIELELINRGVEDIEEREKHLTLYMLLEKIETLKKLLESFNIKEFSAYPGWKAITKINLENKEYKKLIKELEEKESIENIYTNI